MSDFQVLNIESLVYDRENPRLPTRLRGESDEVILKYLAEKTGIENLMTSIGVNGFFAGEAIVATPTEQGKYVVIEGNRRLTALHLLQNPGLAGNRRSILRAAEEAIYRPLTIPVFVVETRDETLQYLGFRHVSGVQRWDPLSKARYLESLFERAEGNPTQRYRTVAREIGSNGATVQRNLNALAAYRIIESEGFYDIDGLGEESFQFGTFYTATGNAEIANFIGIRQDGVPTHPIIDTCVVGEAHLEELTRYMFEEDSKGDTVLGESRNISKLGDVLGSERSLVALRSGQSLETAYRLTPNSREDFIRHINRGIEELKQASANMYDIENYDDDVTSRVQEASKIMSYISRQVGI